MASRHSPDFTSLGPRETGLEDLDTAKTKPAAENPRPSVTWTGTRNAENPKLLYTAKLFVVGLCCIPFIVGAEAGKIRRAV